MEKHLEERLVNALERIANALEGLNMRHVGPVTGTFPGAVPAVLCGTCGNHWYAGHQCPTNTGTTAVAPATNQ